MPVQPPRLRGPMRPTVSPQLAAAATRAVSAASVRPSAMPQRVGFAGRLRQVPWKLVGKLALAGAIGWALLAGAAGLKKGAEGLERRAAETARTIDEVRR